MKGFVMTALIRNLSAVCLLCLIVAPAWAERPDGTVRIATWNIENMNMYFDQTRLPYRSQEKQEVWDDEEDLVEIKLAIEQAHFDPDILVLQEAADQASLDEFNDKWLDGRFAYVKVFKSNSAGQWVAIMVKPGFEVLEVREFADEIDPVNDSALRSSKRYYGGNVLFPRGPGFVKIRTPGGKVLWVGTTHIKSKYGNSQAVTRWRVRMIHQMRTIAGQLRADADLVAVLGDFNDSFGKDRDEEAVGADAIAGMLSGSGRERLLSPTKDLADADANLATYHALLKPGGPSFIDHVFVSPAMHEALVETVIIDDPIAYVASDHLPVMITIKP